MWVNAEKKIAAFVLVFVKTREILKPLLCLRLFTM